MPEKIPRSDIIKDIQRVAEELGKVPTRREYTEHGEYSRTPAENEFGSWTAAREAAGLEGGPQKSTHIPKGEIIEDIQRVADELGKAPSREEYGEHGEYHKTTPERKFGSWTAAREAAGLEGGPSKNTHIPKGDVIEDIQRVAKELGKTPSRREYRECGEYTAWTARQRFGSWARAREAAGLNGAPTKNTFVTKGDIIEDLRRVAHEIGESPSQPQYNKYGQYTHQVAYSRFGGWNAALIEAGLETEKDTRLPDEKFLRDIRSVGEKRGYAPSQAYYRKHGEHGVTTIKRRFDSWNEAVRKAGLEPNGPGANPGERNGYWKGGYEPYYGRNWHEQRRRPGREMGTNVLRAV